MKKSTVHKRLKEKSIRRHRSSIKPILMDENRKARVAYCLSNLEPASCPENPAFKDGYNTVHIDEKWFYRSRLNQKFYLCNDEPDPHRCTKHKSHIDKVMFLCAVARPRFDAAGNCTFDGKLGVRAFVEEVAAKKKSKNRGRGTLETTVLPKVNMQVNHEYLIKHVLPAIKAKWPAEDRHQTIWIQQDNAPSHVHVDDEEVMKAACEGGWHIRLKCQPPNSPDTNILDLGFFCFSSGFVLQGDAKKLARYCGQSSPDISEVSCSAVK